MQKKHKEQLISLINKHGLYDAAKLVGLSNTDLALKSGVELTTVMANDILTELISNKKIPNSYKEFRIGYDGMSGVFTWLGTLNSNYHGEGTYEVIETFATPFWDGTDGIPVDIVFYEVLKEGKIVKSFNEDISGDYYEFIKTRTTFDGIEDLLTWYKHQYLPKVYDMITENLLDEIRKNIKKYE